MKLLMVCFKKILTINEWVAQSIDANVLVETHSNMVAEILIDFGAILAVEKDARIFTIVFVDEGGIGGAKSHRSGHNFVTLGVVGKGGEKSTFLFVDEVSLFGIAQLLGKYFQVEVDFAVKLDALIDKALKFDLGIDTLTLNHLVNGVTAYEKGVTHKFVVHLFGVDEVEVVVFHSCCFFINHLYY